jgi:hypothetical protein
MLTLAELPSAFAAARSAASAAALGVVEDMPRNTCRYCGRYLRLWYQSRIERKGRAA